MKTLADVDHNAGYVKIRLKSQDSQDKFNHLISKGKYSRAFDMAILKAGRIKRKNVYKGHDKGIGLIMTQKNAHWDLMFRDEDH